jgi:hypothetical protein
MIIEVLNSKIVIKEIQKWNCLYLILNNFF